MIPEPLVPIHVKVTLGTTLLHAEFRCPTVLEEYVSNA